MPFFDFFRRPPRRPMLQTIKLRTNADLIDSEYLAQPWTRYQNLAADFNKSYQRQLYDAIPGLKAGLDKYSQITGEMQRGELGADVLFGMQKDAAYQGLSGRGVPGGEMSKFDLLQNLGLTRMDLQQQGQNYAAQQLDFARAMLPEGTGSQFRVDFGTLANRIDQEAYYNNNINNQNSQISWYNSQLRSPFERMVSNTIGSIVSAPFNMFSSLITAPFNAIGGAANMFAGGLAGGLAQQGLDMLGFGGGGGGGGGGFGGGMGLGGGGGYGMSPFAYGAPLMQPEPIQTPAYQMLGSGPMMQSVANMPQSVAASNPMLLGSNQQKFLTTAPTGASTMPVVVGGGQVSAAPFYDSGYSGFNFGPSGLGRSKSNPMELIGDAFLDYGNILFGTGSRSNAGSAMGNRLN